MNKLMILCLAAAIAAPCAAAQAVTTNAGGPPPKASPAQAVASDVPNQVAALQLEVQKLNGELATLQRQSQNEIVFGSPYQQDVPRGD